MKVLSRSKKPSVAIGFAVKTPMDVIRGMKQFPLLMTDELCPECETEVEIPAYRKSLCPNCGKEIIPCSMCNECHSPCVYDVLDTFVKGNKGFDPWDGIHDEILFYEVFEEDGRKLACQRNDFYYSENEGEETPWRMDDYPSTAVVDPEDYRRFGSDAVTEEICGPIDVYDLTEEEAARKYFSLLKQSKYLPLEKVTDATPEGMYWMRYDIPPYSTS